MRRLLSLVLVAAVGVAADAPPPTPPADAPTVDDATAQRAAALIERYDAPPDAAADPDALREIAEIEALIGEAEQDVAQHAVAKATPAFLAASDRLRAMPGPQLASLGKRARAAGDRLAKLAQAVLAEPGLLPNEPAADVATTPDEARRTTEPTPAHDAAPAVSPVDAPETPAHRAPSRHDPSGQ